MTGSHTTPANQAAKGRRPRGGTVDYVAGHVRSLIQAGRLALGQRLIEADMTQQLGVSRGSWREAMGRLAAEGLVELVPNRGALVRRLSRQEITDRYRIREVLEGLAAGLTAERMAEHGERARFIAMLDAVGANPDSPRDANAVFHRTIAEMSGNRELAGLIGQFGVVELRSALNAGYWRASAQEHARIAEAILAGQSDLATQRMREHLRSACERLVSAPDSSFA
ncbi:GntR family transcriptional regulator [Roseomonas chloroacetimidivorans]|uniref:GntR family transcriptional regulator n=1 Tax=Roseomonas chloroacetimidivorans TaxID=1766656 RepID=UPI003C755C4D